MRTLKKAFTATLLSLCGLSISSLANANYSLCSQAQIDHAKTLLHTEFEKDTAYQSCLVVDSKAQKLLFANSRVIASTADDIKTYDLTTYLVDTNTNQVVKSQVLDRNVVSDAIEFNGIEFDITAFSTLKNQNVTGLKTKFYHRGGISHGENELRLLKINDNSILPIGNIVTEESNSINWDSICKDKGGHSSQVERLLILSNHKTNGLQDIIVKATKTNLNTIGKSCQDKTTKWRQQSILKFDGKTYQGKLDTLSPDGM